MYPSLNIPIPFTKFLEDNQNYKRVEQTLDIKYILNLDIKYMLLQTKYQ